MCASRTRRRAAQPDDRRRHDQAERQLVTYVARDLEPYRGFHVMMRAVPHLLRARKDIRVVLVGADGISYGAPPPEGTWRQTMLAELGDGIDPKRVVFPGRIDYPTYVAMLQRSDAHVYLTYPFVASCRCARRWRRAAS
jgi:glycosyltransferase involved in cell wall biosynthesis